MISWEGAMQPRVQELQGNVSLFVEALLSAQPPVDFHLGVITADADDPSESGHLHTWTNADHPQGGSYLACDVHGLCNTATDAGELHIFSRGRCPTTLQRRGHGQPPIDRGLLTTYLALTDPANQDEGSGGFLRSGAALRIVTVADDDDVSCSPMTGAPTSPDDYCTDDPGCHCADDLSYGSADYWANFFGTLKGAGLPGRVKASAWVGADMGPVAARGTGLRTTRERAIGLTWDASTLRSPTPSIGESVTRRWPASPGVSLFPSAVTMRMRPSSAWRRRSPARVLKQTAAVRRRPGPSLSKPRLGVEPRSVKLLCMLWSRPAQSRSTDPGRKAPIEPQGNQALKGRHIGCFTDAHEDLLQALVPGSRGSHPPRRMRQA